MESTLRLEIKVGLLVLVGLLATVVLILVSDRINLEDEYTLNAYLPDAGGLLVGSPVTLSGIRIGRVVSIKQSDDPRGAIRADLRVKESAQIHETCELSIATSGILGDAYLAFSGPDEKPGQLLATDGSAEVIASPGFFDELSQQATTLLDNANALIDDEATADVKRLISNAADLAGSSATLIAGLENEKERIGSIIGKVDTLVTTIDGTVSELGTKAGTGIDAAVASLKSVESQLETVVPELQKVATSADAALKSAEGVLNRTDAILASGSKDIGAALGSLAALLQDAAGVVRGIRDGNGLVGQLLSSNALAKSLNDIAIDLENAAARIADTPAILVWGEDEEGREAARQTREANKERRAFMEGYDEKPLPTDPIPSTQLDTVPE